MNVSRTTRRSEQCEGSRRSVRCSRGPCRGRAAVQGGKTMQLCRRAHTPPPLTKSGNNAATGRRSTELQRTRRLAACLSRPSSSSSPSSRAEQHSRLSSCESDVRPYSRRVAYTSPKPWPCVYERAYRRRAMHAAVLVSRLNAPRRPRLVEYYRKRCRIDLTQH